MSCENYNIELCNFCEKGINRQFSCWINHFKRSLFQSSINGNQNYYITAVLSIIDAYYIYFKIAANIVNPDILKKYRVIKLLK